MKIYLKKLYEFILKKYLYARLKRNKCVSIGKNVLIKGQPTIKIKASSKLEIGNEVVLNSNPYGYHTGMAFPVLLSADGENSKISIGDMSRLHGCAIHAKKEIKIGKQCLIAAGCHILDSNGHISDLRYAKFRQHYKDEPASIIIEANCWLGINSIVLKGVHLGKGCIVGANSVVLGGEYPPYSLISGNPAIVVKTIDECDILNELSDEDKKRLSGFTLNYG